MELASLWAQATLEFTQSIYLTYITVSTNRCIQLDGKNGKFLLNCIRNRRNVPHLSWWKKCKVSRMYSSRTIFSITGRSPCVCTGSSRHIPPLGGKREFKTAACSTRGISSDILGGPSGCVILGRGMGCPAASLE